MRCLYYIFILFFSSYVLAQEQDIVTQYLKKIKLSTSDTAKLIAYTTLTEYCELEDIPLYAEKSIEISNAILNSTKNNSIKLVALINKNRALNNYAFYLYEKGIFKKSLEIWDRLMFQYDSLLSIYKNRKDLTTDYINVINNKASVLESMSSFNASVELYFKALKLSETINDSTTISRIYNNLGFIYKPLKDKEKSLNYYFNALKIKEKLKDSIGIATILNNIGALYLDNKEKTKAESFFLKSLNISTLIQNNELIVISKTNLGKLYTDLLHFDKAQKYLSEALITYRQLGKEIETGITYYDFANLFLNMYVHLKKNYFLDSSMHYAKKAEFIAEKYKSNQLLLNVYQILSSIYSLTNNHLLSLNTHFKYDSINNLLKLHEVQRTASMQQLEYEYDKILYKNKTEYEKNIAIAKEKNQKQRIIITISIIAFILALLFIAFIIRTMKILSQKKKIIENQKVEVETQKEIIEKKQKDILDSIQYSKLIQKSILPHRSDIWKALPQSFVLYLPKDIVAGDFYWFHKFERFCLIAVADSTGHGIPGAFMSILNTDKLNEAINHTQEVNEILYLVNNNVKKTLKQFENSQTSKDGMDIILVKIPYIELSNHSNSVTIELAGANRPLFVYRHDSKIIEEIKTTKSSIGGHTPEYQKFEKYSIILNKNDVIYLTTDGYIDQFGGEKNKKLMSKGFKDLIQSIGHLHYQKQKAELEKFFEQWKNNNEQTDDVCIIGIKI